MNPPKLLLDENLSPWAAQVLRARGIDAVHVRDRGPTDAQVLARAFAEDRILVTMNVSDFEKLARAAELHAGIALIEESGLSRSSQLEVIWTAIMSIEAEQAAGRDMVNRAVRVRAGSYIFEPLPD